MKESIVISLGGSVVVAEDTSFVYFSELAELIHRFTRKYQIYLVIGGGHHARTYIQRGRKLHLSEFQLDEIGIMLTRVNARLLSFVLEATQKKIPETTDEAASIESSIVVMGGTSPGHSTDFVGAELAMKTKAYRYVIATNVDGVYDKDPRKHPDARFLPKVSIDELLGQYGSGWDSAGSNMVIDGPALQMIKNHNISTSVINGKNIKELEKIFEKKKFHGTEIKI